jgi:hypothetical protein
MSIAIRWFKNAEFDAPALNSPQPCIHGAGCVFTIKNAEGKVVPGCCHFVHPGEEGTGRMRFPPQVGPKGAIIKPACVRLTGKAGFYERCRLKMSWQAWCERENIPYTPNKAGVRHAPVVQFPLGKLSTVATILRSEANALIERLSILVKESPLSAEDKDETEDDLRTDLLEGIWQVISKVERSLDVPLTAEEKMHEEATVAAKMMIDKMFEPSKRTVKIVMAEPEAEAEP